MIKSIWDKIKLAFERKPIGEIVKPELPKGSMVTIETPQQTVIKVKRKYVKKTKV
jgi:hypothetical protein